MMMKKGGRSMAEMVKKFGAMKDKKVKKGMGHK